MKGPTSRRRAFARTALPPALIVAVVFLFHPRVTLLGETFFFRDVYSFHYPMKHLVATALGHGELPLWNSRTAGGQPVLANPNYGALSPFNLPLLVFPFERGFPLAEVLGFMLAGTGMYALARGLGLGRPASMLSGCAFPLMGPITSLGNLFNANGACALMPWIFLTGITAARRRTGLAAAGFAGLLALQVFCGEPVFVMITVGGLTWVVLTGPLAPAGPDRRARSALVVAAATALSFLVASIQVVPTLELLALSVRGKGLTTTESEAWSLHPFRVIEMVLPWAFGNPATAASGGFRGEDLGDKGMFYLVHVYLGVCLIVLAAVALRGRQGLTWGGCGVAALLLAFGKHLPFFGALHAVFPPLRLVRYPEKFMVLAALCCAVLAGTGLQRLADEGAGSRARRVAGALACLLACALPGLSFLARRGASGKRPSALPVDALGLSGPQWITLAVLLAAAVILATGVGKRLGTGSWAGVIIFLACGDLFVANFSVNPTIPAAEVGREPIFAGEVRARGGGRVYMRFDLDSALRELMPRNESGRPPIWIGQALGLYQTFLLSGLDTAFGENVDGLLLGRTERLGRALTGAGPRLGAGVLAASGVRFVATTYMLPPEAYILVRDYAPAWPVKLYEVKEACGDVRCAVSSRTAVDFDEAVAWMTAPSRRPCEDVILGDGPGNEVARAQKGEAAAAPPGHPAARVISRSERSIEIETRGDTSCVAVYAQTFYPGWRAWVDGRPEKVVAADTAFLAVEVPAGAHHVSFRFRPRSVAAGAALSAAGVLVMAFLVFRRGRGIRTTA